MNDIEIISEYDNNVNQKDLLENDNLEDLIKLKTDLFTDSEKGEFDLWCETLYKYTEQIVKNPTKANKWVFGRISHDAWTLKKFSPHVASKKAYEDFMKRTGYDIRNYDWLDSVKDKNGNRFVVHKSYMEEHLTTANDFRNELLYLCSKKELTIDKVKELLLQQKVCWITREEDKCLTKNNYTKHRPDPLNAYEKCGIEIYEPEKSNLNNIMKSTYHLNKAYVEKKNLKTSSQNKTINKCKIRPFFLKLQKHFEKNLINGKRYELNVFENANWAIIYKDSYDAWVGLRLEKNVDELKDICIYFNNPKTANSIFYGLKHFQEEFENDINEKGEGHLSWIEKGKQTKTDRPTRISRFSIRSNDIDRFVYKSTPYDISIQQNSDEAVKFIAEKLVIWTEAYIKFVNKIDVSF